MIQYKTQSIKHKGSGLEVVLGDSLYNFLKQATFVANRRRDPSLINQDVLDRVDLLCEDEKAFSEEWELTV